MPKLQPSKIISGADLRANAEPYVGAILTLPREVEVAVDQSEFGGRGAEKVYASADVRLEWYDETAGTFGCYVIDPVSGEPVTEAPVRFEVEDHEAVEVWS